MLMHEMFGWELKEGEVGIEIELEGRRLPCANFGSWRAERDGSLRGESIELVLKEPATRDQVPVRLKSLLRKLHVFESQVNETDRAGIHVHINIQDLTEIELVNFICLYLTYENTLVEYCGAKRVGNLFCLRTCDASGYIELLRKVVQTGAWHMLGTDELRYASMNLKAVAQYGSLEFRAMRSTIDIDVIQTWVNLLLSLKDRAKEFPNPINIVEEFSVQGVEAAFAATFGPLTAVLNFDPVSMMTGIRNAQLIAYCRADWDQPVVGKDEDEGDGLEVVDELRLEDVLERADENRDIHVVFKDTHYYRVRPEGYDIDLWPIGNVWFTANQVMAILNIDDEAVAEMNPWMKFVRKYVGDNYSHHAGRHVRNVPRPDAMRFFQDAVDRELVRRGDQIPRFVLDEMNEVDEDEDLEIGE